MTQHDSTTVAQLSNLVDDLNTPDSVTVAASCACSALLQTRCMWQAGDNYEGQAQCAGFSRCTGGSRRMKRTGLMNCSPEVCFFAACRCPPPERIIINYAVRALIDLLSSTSRSLSGALVSRAGSMGTAVAAAAVGSSMGLGSRSNRANGTMPSAFGEAPGSYSNLTGLAATPSGAATPAAQQQQAAGSPPLASTPAAAQQSGATTNSNTSAARMGSAASASSLDGVAGGAAAVAAGLPGVAEEPGDRPTDSVRSRFVQPTANGSGLASAGEASPYLHLLWKFSTRRVPCNAEACHSIRPSHCTARVSLPVLQTCPVLHQLSRTSTLRA
jgi:hypothetical protein